MMIKRNSSSNIKSNTKRRWFLNSLNKTSRPPFNLLEITFCPIYRLFENCSDDNLVLSYTNRIPNFKPRPKVISNPKRILTFNPISTLTLALNNLGRNKSLIKCRQIHHSPKFPKNIRIFKIHLFCVQ